MSEASRFGINSAELDRVRQPSESAWSLPPAAYSNPDVFDAEVDAIFRKQWVCVARQEQIAQPGDYLCLDFFGQPIVMVRDLDGQLHAHASVCLHRAQPVVEGSGNATRFVCPYHHWTYELTGELRSAPMMEGAEGFSTDDFRLPSLGLEIWEGFVFVNQDPYAPPLTPRLSELQELIGNFDFSQQVVTETVEFDSPWNWKILVENFMEAYHHIGPHKHTFEPVYPARQSYIPDNDGAPWVVLRMPGKAGAQEGHSAGLYPRLDESQQHELLAMCVYPTLLFAASATTCVWYQLEPSAHNAMRLKIHALAPPEAAAVMSDEDRQMLRGALQAIHEEDIVVNEGPWRGLQAPMTRQGRLSSYEKSIWQLNQLWADALGL